jgi:hypothetical protein
MVMMRLIAALTILLLGARIAEFPTLPFGNRSNLDPWQSACRALLSVLSGPVLERLGGTQLFSPQVDGGGDGGGGDGGGGDGGDGAGTSGGGDGNGGAGTSSDGSTDGDSGTGEGNSGDSDSNGDSPGADPGAVGAPGDPGDPDDAPANAPSTVSVTSPSDIGAPAQSNPTTDPSDLSSVANPNDVPTDDPGLGLRGPGSSGGILASNFGRLGSGAETLPVASNGVVPSRSVDVGINAVIVSGAQTPWGAIGKGPGVRNVAVTGGIIALGETPLAAPSPTVTTGAADHPPTWLRLKPDLRYLNGSLFPPIVPNVIDIRIISFTEQAIENSSN